jgi:site-specific recombinase XerD
MGAEALPDEPSGVDILREYGQGAHLGDSERTRTAYLTHARLFLEWLEDTGLQPGHVTAATLAWWRRAMQEAGFRPATLSLKLVAVRKFLLWAQAEGHTPQLAEDDLTTRLRNGQRTSLAVPKVHAGPVRCLDFADLQKLLQAPLSYTKADGSPRGNSLRDAVIVSLLALRGLRESELVGLTIGSFEPRGEGAALTVEGKGRKRRQLDLDPELWGLVRAYIEQSGRSVSNADRGARLLLGQRGPMTVQGVIDVVRRHGRRALDRDDLTPHMLRRTFATLASRELRDKRGRVVKPAIPPYALQRLLGHEDLKTTQRYVDAAAEADSIPTGTYLGVAPPQAPAQTETDDEA